MKILQVLDSYPPDLNGGAYFTHRLSKQLRLMGHDVMVICPSLSRRSYFDSYEGIKLFRVKSYPVLFYRNFRVSIPLGISESIRQVINEFKPDVVHLQGRFFLGDMCSKIAVELGLPMVATNHFMPENFFHYTRLPQFFYKWFSTLAYAWVHGMFRRAQIWTAPTTTAVELLKKHGFSKKIHAISCGIDLQLFGFKKGGQLIPEEIRQFPLMLYAGRIDKEKNLPVVIDALAILQAFAPCKLIIVGDGAERESLQKYIKGLNLCEQVYFCGYLSDADYPGIFSEVDCFVHAGTAELQSIVTLEALASGLPVVAAKSIALPELVVHGVNGFLFEPNKAQEAADYLRKILWNTELRIKMGRESSRISQAHDISITGAKFVALYKRAMNESMGENAK